MIAVLSVVSMVLATKVMLPVLAEPVPVIVMVFESASVVIEIPSLANKVNVSVAESATIELWPATNTLLKVF